MSHPCATVKIKATSGSYPYSIINEEDFDAAKHELYADAPVEAAQAEAAAWGDVTGDGSGEALPPADNELKAAPAKHHRKGATK